MSRARWLLVAACLATLCACRSARTSSAVAAQRVADAGASGRHWVAAWTAAPTGAAALDADPASFQLHLAAAVSGDGVRLVLSNRYGAGPVTFAVALQNHTMTFGSRETVSVPAGGAVTTDPVALHVTAGARLDVYVVAGGRAVTTTAAGACCLTELDVRAPQDVHAVVVAGSSVALGYLADGPPWPELVATRLGPARRPVSVVNESIGATRLLSDDASGPSVLSRESAELLTVSGVRTIVLADLVNDIQQEPHVYDAAALTAGISAFVRTAHARHVRVIVSTLPPYGGYARFTARGEACREAVNRFIRTSGVPDAVVDLDAVLRDPAQPGRLAREFDAGDHMHQTEAGQVAIARAVIREL